MGGFVKIRKPDGSKHDLYGDGLRIFTTIDSRMQLAGEEAVSAHMKKFTKRVFPSK